MNEGDSIAAYINKIWEYAEKFAPIGVKFLDLWMIMKFLTTRLESYQNACYDIGDRVA